MLKLYYYYMNVFRIDLDEIMAKSTNYSELTEAWVNWRDASGKQMRADFITYYTLGNKAAKLNQLPTQSNTLYYYFYSI